MAYWSSPARPGLSTSTLSPGSWSGAGVDRDHCGPGLPIVQSSHVVPQRQRTARDRGLAYAGRYETAANRGEPGREHENDHWRGSIRRLDLLRLRCSEARLRIGACEVHRNGAGLITPHRVVSGTRTAAPASTPTACACVPGRPCASGSTSEGATCRLLSPAPASGAHEPAW